MPLARLIALSLVTLALADCSQPPPTVGEAKDFLAVCDKVNEGKRVAVEGYLRLPRVFTGTSTVVLDLYRLPDFASIPIGVEIHLGNQANQVETVPKQYTEKDLKVHLANGEVTGAGTRVRVSGTMYFPALAPGGVCALRNPLVELAK